VLSERRSEHITPLFRDLHWLRVPERIRCCICVPTQRCLDGTSPPYLEDGIPRAADVDGRQPSLPPVDGSRRPARSSIDARRPGFPCRRFTGPRGTVCRRPSQLHHRFSLSDESSGHFCSRLTDLTVAVDYVKCPCSVFVTVSPCIISTRVIIIIITTTAMGMGQTHGQRYGQRDESLHRLMRPTVGRGTRRISLTLGLLDGGTTFHRHYGGRDLPSTPSDNL